MLQIGSWWSNNDWMPLCHGSYSSLSWLQDGQAWLVMVYHVSFSEHWPADQLAMSIINHHLPWWLRYIGICCGPTWFYLDVYPHLVAGDDQHDFRGSFTQYIIGSFTIAISQEAIPQLHIQVAMLVNESEPPRITRNLSRSPLIQQFSHHPPIQTDHSNTICASWAGYGSSHQPVIWGMWTAGMQGFDPEPYDPIFTRYI